MTDAPVMKPQMTEWERKLVIHPNLSSPTAVYRHPANKATCKMHNMYEQHEAGQLATIMGSLVAVQIATDMAQQTAYYCLVEGGQAGA